MKQKLIELKGKTDKFTIIVGDFNIPFSTIDWTWQKIFKDIEELNNTINQKDLINIYKTLHTTEE